MVAKIVLQPNPTPPQMVRVLGTGFDKRTFVSIVFDGVGSTTKFKPAPDGSFNVGLDVVSTKPDGIYTVQARKAGTTTVLASASLTVKRPVADAPPLVTAGPVVSNITESSATISWSLSEPCTGKVNFGYTTSYGTSTPEEINLMASHVQNPSGLLSNKDVFFEVVGHDSANQSYVAQGSFKTTFAAPAFPTNLQTALDAAASGATIDVTGGPTYDPIVIKKSVTLVGAKIRGTQHTTYVGGQDGISIQGSKAAPIQNVTLRNCDVSNLGAIGIRSYFVDNLVIEDSLVTDCVYTGIMVLSNRGGSILGNTVQRIGVMGAAANSNNAYGIALSQQVPGTDYVTSDFWVDGNIVEDVPTWHAYDTHSGARIVWTNNIARRSRSGFFITGGNGQALDNDINGNTVEAPVNADHYAITSVYSTNGFVRNNRINGWPVGHEILTTSSGDPSATAINLTISGNIINGNSPSPTNGVYGSAFASDALNNSRVGYGGYSYAYRFKAEQASTLESVRIYIIANGNTGYSNGDGGVLRVDLYNVDASLHPAGASLAGATHTPGNPTGNNFPEISLSPKVTLQKDTRYALVWTNPSSTNYVSLDGTYTFDDDTPDQPRWPQADLEQLERIGNGAWNPRTEGGITTPIFQLRYGNGSYQGQGYMETWGTGRGDGYALANGTSKLREVFTTTSSMVVSKVFVRLAKTGGSSPLNLRLEKADGTLIEAVSIPATSINTAGLPSPNGVGQRWASAAFSSPKTLAQGSYNLVLSTSSGTTYWTTPARKGISYGFQPVTYFADGHSQDAPDGVTWGDTKAQTGNRIPHADLQFYFELA